MITGYNTDIPFNGKVYHVQTEDRGMKNPIVESLVYCRGEILTSRKTSYVDLIESGHFADIVLQRRMETQHNDLMREIRNGGFEDEDTMPFGHSIITNRTLDEVVVAFLAEHVALDEIDLELTPIALGEGGKAGLTLTVKERRSGRPISGAAVEVRLVTTGDVPRRLLSALSDAEGRIRGDVLLPDPPEPSAALVCRAEFGGKSSEIRERVGKRAAIAPRSPT